MPRIKLIASDLDGTLLLNGARECNAELFPIIQELSKKGVYFVPSSGRQYPNLQRLFKTIPEDIMYLCENGALVMYLDQPLVKSVFEDSLALEIAHAVYEHPDCEVLISGERTSYVIPKDESFATYLRDQVGNHITIIDSPERITEPIMKVSYYTKAEKRDACTVHFEKIFGGQCLIVTSGNEWVDFAPNGTSKGSALASIGEKLGIAAEEMAAFGDNENDRTMLEYVGHPYLMDDCNPSMLDVKATRCSKVEDELKKILLELQ